MSTADSGEKLQVKIAREFAASAENVFDAWLDPELVGRWMFGSDVRDEEIVKLETDPRVGGTFSFMVRRGDDVLNHVGTYREIRRPERLVFSWGIEGVSEEESVVRIDFETSEAGCRLTLIHELQSQWAEYADRTKAGWNLMLDKLEQILE